ncbi:SAM-dependent methyltransferase [Marinobacterium lacunae]|uniref:SAM-dependent methyltransferase n=1 Tax=Marinobacterium lacunae TaxID=1232683 RepID=A0A081G3C2_9GAMM|nr:class I SAM-dependent methyltransferase [Marinobacterium lacunae]KEA65277.1 SAM-dependent methyltransferase [Marinobacterium lacunae]
MSRTDLSQTYQEQGDLFARILAALADSGRSTDRVTVEDLAPVDHFHARGFPATVELAERLPIKAGDRLVDIGCGVGGPARYLAKRFGCHVSGIDITARFVDTGNKLTELVGLTSQVEIELGDGQTLPYADAQFDGAYSQHVTMNVPDRAAFFAEACRVLKPGAFFALTEHGLGPTGDPRYPVPWSDDGRGAYLITPNETRAALEAAGFTDIHIQETGQHYLSGYKAAVAKAEAGTLPAFGVHLLMGDSAVDKIRNAGINIEEGRTCPIQVICRKA